MNSFLNWAGRNAKELPLFEPVRRKHQACSELSQWAYPDAYVRQQYPDLYFVLRRDALFKMKGHQPNRKSPGKNDW